MVGIAALGGMAAPLASASAKAKPKPRRARYSYCADADTRFRYPHPYVGISDTFVQYGSGRYQACSLGRMAATGIGYFRAVMSWRDVELTPGHYNMSTYDSLVADVAWHRLSLLAVLYAAPTWRSTAPAKNALPGFYPPRSRADFAHFVLLCVERYGPNGSFWRENPTVPYHPIRVWEVWNEPNLAQSWEPAANASAYASLLQAAYQAIKGADPGATVVSGGMPFFGDPDETAYVTALLRAGAARYFDDLGLHTYAATVGGAEERLRTARKLLDFYNAAGAGLWVTESGWAGGNPDDFISSVSGQRASAATFFSFVKRERKPLRIRGVIWFLWQDRHYAPGPKSWWGFHLGLVTQQGRPKPVLAVISAAAKVLQR